MPDLVSADGSVTLFLAINECCGTALPAFSQGVDLCVAARPSEGLQVLLGDAATGLANRGTVLLPHSYTLSLSGDNANFVLRSLGQSRYLRQPGHLGRLPMILLTTLSPMVSLRPAFTSASLGYIGSPSGFSSLLM
jgi:hypothetical protein